MFLKKYFISYVYFDKNGLKGFGNGTTLTTKMTIDVLLNFSKDICKEYGYNNVVVLSFHKIKKQFN